MQNTRGDYTKQEVVTAFDSLGSLDGACVMVHSALHTFGFIKDGRLDEICPFFFEELRRRVGSEGTVVVPTFNFGFCKGETFDPLKTPSDRMGIFSEYVRQLPGAISSKHPMQRVSAIGRQAEYICASDTSSGYGIDSAFDRMLALGAKILLLGVSTQWVAFVQYAEEHAKVPYRYWKTFTGSYVSSGQTQTRSYTMYVRDLDLDPQVKIHRIGDILDAKGQLIKSSLGRGEITLLNIQEYISTAMEVLKNDPNYMIR